MDFTKLAGEIGTVSHAPPSNPVDIIGDSYNYYVAGEEANNLNTSQRTQFTRHSSIAWWHFQHCTAS
ncbi:hypothetical protein SLA2020_202430 [Shorea laevis]